MLQRRPFAFRLQLFDPALGPRTQLKLGAELSSCIFQSAPEAIEGLVRSPRSSPGRLKFRSKIQRVGARSLGPFFSDDPLGPGLLEVGCQLSARPIASLESLLDAAAGIGGGGGFGAAVRFGG